MDRWVYEALKIASVNFTNIQYIPEILVQLLLLSPHSKIPHTHSADFACFFLCLCGFSPGNPASFHRPEICIWEMGQLMTLI